LQTDDKFCVTQLVNKLLDPIYYPNFNPFNRSANNERDKQVKALPC